MGMILPPAPGGPIDDATCDVEQLEEANDSQLHSILAELKNTAFFRSFAVDLDHGCPLSKWRPAAKSKKGGDAKAKKEEEEDRADGGTDESAEEGEKKGEEAKTESNDEEEEESTQCASEGLPDLDPDAEPACSVQTDDDAGMPFQTASSPMSAGQSLSEPASPVEEKKGDEGGGKAPLDGEAEEMADGGDEEEAGAEGDDEDDFECTGGDMEDEMDEDAEPLCSLASDGLELSLTPLRDMLSSALNHIYETMGWESEEQRKTFAWTRPSSPIVVTENDNGEPCDDEADGVGAAGSLPDTFWVDMCSNIKAGEDIRVVNLEANPERNTGYNGTHIWRAIYEENCIDIDRSTSDPMCYEERVLYRLLSGMHASTTLSIAKNYYPPSKRKKRVNWEANPRYFMDKFGSNPEYIRNLHFSYVVLLRALRKASPFLRDYEIKTGNIVEDETAAVLLRRLLDSTILRSCHDVFSAFDESLMFREPKSADDDSAKKNRNDVLSLKSNFKGVFHNISSILDCVQCQQCKLHGKLTMLGYGTALKILFLPREDLLAASLSRNEVVAFVNTIARMSESIKEVRELTAMYWRDEMAKQVKADPSLPAPDVADGGVVGDGGGGGSEGAAAAPADLVDAAVGAAAKLASGGYISEEREAELVRLAFARDSNLLTLARYYTSDLNKFLLHSQSIGALGGEMVLPDDDPDAVVVGSGLAGLAAALNILDRGGRVVVVEKEHRMGGNSNKASSGINGCCPNETIVTHDSVDTFRNDTIKSAGDAAQLPLIETLVQNSASAVTWLRERVGVDLSLLAQLGGHRNKRTHRPKNGMVGAEIIYGVQKAVKEYEKKGTAKILVDTKVTGLVRDDEGRVVGVDVDYVIGEDSRPTRLTAPNIVLATGGFASDRSEHSYLAQYRPELMHFPATAGDFSTGDGVGLATKLGAGTVNMDKIQIHPTGWVDPSDPSNPTKVLAAELMRGVGGVLINSEGKRFCNELGTRAYVTDKMLSHDEHYAAEGKWNANAEIPTFSLVLSSSAAEDGWKHVSHYTHKKLLKEIKGVTALAEWMGVDVDAVRSTLEGYREDASAGVDAWGKTSFRGVPSPDLDGETFYAGTVVPVLHYCMGGVTIDPEGNVLDVDRNPIPGLHAAGEVSGGVHGNNRLGGNSLLECTVFGTIVGRKLPVKERKPPAALQVGGGAAAAVTSKKKREVTAEELARHSTLDDCWVAIHGNVYDLTEFAEEHPPGAESIIELAGTDGTEAFQAIHNKDMIDDFGSELIGALVITSS